MTGTPWALDEDGDAIGDRCDNCPASANPTQADTTEVAQNQGALPDGLGDACDRRPALGGDEIAAFFPWASSDEQRVWSGAGWTIEDDTLRATSDARWQSVRRWTDRRRADRVAGVDRAGRE